MKYLIFTKVIWDTTNKNITSQKRFIRNKIVLKEIKKINPQRIFFIHWSTLIPKDLYLNYECIQFHCANLPKFRGGSPVQNQILKGLKKTKLCAFKVEKKLDSGDLCLKKDLNLNGSAEDIFKRIENIAFKEIKTSLIKKNLKFKKQNGKSSFFKRRNPYQSKIPNNINKITKIYDYIRMLDAKKYPRAFLNLKNFKVEFFNSLKKKDEIYGNFKIYKK